MFNLFFFSVVFMKREGKKGDRFDSNNVSTHKEKRKVNVFMKVV